MISLGTRPYSTHTFDWALAEGKSWFLGGWAVDPRETQRNLRPVKDFIPISFESKIICIYCDMTSQKAWAATPTLVIAAPPSKALEALDPVRCLLRCTKHWSCTVSEHPLGRIWAAGREVLPAPLGWAEQRQLLPGDAPPNPADLVPWVTLPQDTSLLNCCQNDGFSFFFLFISKGRLKWGDGERHLTQCWCVLLRHWSNCCCFLQEKLILSELSDQFCQHSAAAGKEFSVIQQIDTLNLHFHNSSEAFLLFPLFANTLQFALGKCGTGDREQQNVILIFSLKYSKRGAGGYKGAKWQNYV